MLKEPLQVSLATYGALQAAKLDVGIANARPPFLPTGHHELRFTRR